MPNRVTFDEKEMMIITVKYIVIIAILMICSVHTCIQTFHYCLSVFCRGCVFALLSHKFWKWRSQNWPCGTSGAYWFWPGAGCYDIWSIPMAKITWYFTGIPVVVTVVLIGVLDFWTTLVLQFSDNTYRLSLWKWVPANSRHSNGPMKIFLTWAAHSRCPMARNRKQQNCLRIFAVQPVEKKCQDSQASETDAHLPAVTVRLCQSWLCT